MTAEIIQLDTTFWGEFEPDFVLEKAKGLFPEQCIVIGVDADGRLQFMPSMSDGAVALWLIKMVEATLISEGLKQCAKIGFADFDG